MVVVVFVENGGHGNLAAAPLAKALFEARFGIAPKTPPDPAVRAAAPVAPVAPAVPGIARASRRQTP